MKTRTFFRFDNATKQVMETRELSSDNQGILDAASTELLSNGFIESTNFLDEVIPAGIYDEGTKKTAPMPKDG